jgi:hypothetical protein
MEEEPIIVRVGTFFVVVGLGSFILFVASDIAEQPDFDYLFAAMILIAIGWMFRRNKPPPPPAGRFSIFRTMRENAKRRREAREKAKTEKK